jgi:DNA-directed RNA polymerase subunit RPC12/RpoP
MLHSPAPFPRVTCAGFDAVPNDPASEDRAIDHARVVTCPHCGQGVDLPIEAPWLLHDQLQHAPTLVAVRCPQCCHEIDLVS